MRFASGLGCSHKNSQMGAGLETGLFEPYLGVSDWTVAAVVVGVGVGVVALAKGPPWLWRLTVRRVRRRRRPELNPLDPVATTADYVRYGWRPAPGPLARVRRAVQGRRRP